MNFSGITANNREKDGFWIRFRRLILADRSFMLLNTSGAISRLTVDWPGSKRKEMAPGPIFVLHSPLLKTLIKIKISLNEKLV